MGRAFPIYEIGGNIELRVTWQIPVDMFKETVASPEWHIYVDVVTGEVVEENLLIFF